MASATKGNGTTARRRIKSAVKKAAAAMQESNGALANNGTPDAGSDSEVKIETIRLRAYEFFLARGATHGHDLADWLNAERQVLGAQKT
ncbi:MAG TPA: DUF2934 domain-containing protein [Candidatus Binataceae bacterium]|nr:DUF2934 domain-containing protein [Candidatus Binataceae bacterium]